MDFALCSIKSSLHAWCTENLEMCFEWNNHLENVLGENLEGGPFSPLGKLSDFPRSRFGDPSRFLALSPCWLLSDDFPFDSWWWLCLRSESPPCSRFWTAFRPLSKFWSSVAICERRSFKKLSRFVSFDRALVELEPYQINMNFFSVTKKHACSLQVTTCVMTKLRTILLFSLYLWKHVSSMALCEAMHTSSAYYILGLLETFIRPHSEAPRRYYLNLLIYGSRSKLEDRCMKLFSE